MVRDCLPDSCSLLNLYGCTEAAGDSTWYEIGISFTFSSVDIPTSALSQSMPLGIPLDQTCILLMEPIARNDSEWNAQNDRNERIGEICITGEGLCHGYYNSHASEPDSSFFEVPVEEIRNWISTGFGFASDDWNPKANAHFFRTGDLGCISSGRI